MIKIPKDPSDVPRKQEDSSSNYEKAKESSASASSSWSSMEQQWVRLKDPRIVRVARSCGGKDRHSKVCTIRGLRDRRVRLSVPTAIQLYDLQERLGFNQPSKVIDWLLNAAKNDIDELPPLPPLDLALLHHHAILTSNNNSQPNKEEAAVGWEASNNNTTFWKLIEPKEASSSHDDDVKQGSNNDNDELSHHAVQVVPHHHHHHHPSFVGYNQWEGSGSGGHRVSHQTDLQSINVVPFSSTLSLCTGDSSHHHHFASHFGANIDMDHNNNIPRQVTYNNHYPMMLQSSSSNLYPISSMEQSLNKPFGLSMMTPKNTSDQSHHQSHNHHLQNFPAK